MTPCCLHNLHLLNAEPPFQNDDIKALIVPNKTKQKTNAKKGNVKFPKAYPSLLSSSSGLEMSWDPARDMSRAAKGRSL